jgi:hypothetical protein
MSTSTTKRIVKLWNPAIDDDRPNVTTDSTISIANTDHLAKSTQQINNNNYAHLASIMMIMQQEQQQPSLNNQLTSSISPPSNPIVKSIIVNNQSSCINENCCAICGADFRLIGDLVHHMRTNHRSCSSGVNGRRTISMNNHQNRRRQSSTKMLINNKHRKCATNVVDNNHTDNRLLLLNAADFALKCPICSQKFDERNGLLLHIQTHNQL